MKTKKVTVLLSFFIFLSFPLVVVNAQIKVESTGRVKAGNVTPASVPCDPDNVANLMLFGNSGDYRAGSKLTFGDFGKQSVLGLNALIGEYGTTDTDQLWLHGKNGIYLTYSYGYSNNIIGYYDANVGHKFTFNCDVYSSGVKLASDERFKENISPLQSSMASIAKLSGVSYNLNGLAYGKKNNASGEGTQSSGNENLSEKEKKDKDALDKREKEQNKPGKKHLGFLAQELQQVFPELVETGQDGYLYVDYIGLIPVIVEGMKEQSRIIDAQSQKIKELEGIISMPDKKNGGASLKSSSAGISTGISTTAGNAGNAFLYQNSPNPFTEQTEIRYFLPEDVKNAFICLFDMQGMLLKKITVDNKGSILIDGSELHAGMYIYTLIVNGQEVDTKRMILTK